MKEWVKMPSYWVRDKDNLPLPDLKWIGAKKADQIAALMIYIILVQHANDSVTKDKKEIGLCSLTYTDIGDISGLSRAKISGGIKVLVNLQVISEISEGRNNIYKITNYGANSGWAKLPARGLYDKNIEKINAFHQFHLRTKNELNAIKIYLLIVSLRNNSINYAQVGYSKISEYTGIHRNEIKTAISLLINIDLIQVDSISSEINEYSTVNMYRLTKLEPYKHRGTTAKDIAALKLKANN